MRRLSHRTPRRVAGALLAVTLTAGTAWAFWTTGTAPGSNGAAAAATVGQPDSPVATAQGRDVTVSWSPTTLSSGAAVAGYRLSRSAAGDPTPQPIGVGCSGLVATTSCTETGVPEGRWRYTVTAVVGDNWRGPDSRASNEVVVDVTGPTGGSVDAAGLGSGRYSTTQSLSIAFSPGTDPHGIAATGARLLRAQAPLSNGGCGTFGTYALVTGGEDPVSPKSDAVPSGSACYRYQYVAKDTFGNATSYTSPDIKVDTSAPSAPSLSFGTFSNASTAGTTVWYRPGGSGSFRLTAFSTDGGSGVSAYNWPTLGTGWTRSTISATTSQYSWTASPTEPGAHQVSATNGAGLVSTATGFTAAADGTAPAGSTIQYADGLTTADTVVVTTTTGSDTQSGITSRLLQRAVAPMTDSVCGAFGSFTTVAHGTDPRPTREDQIARGSCYVYRYVVRDAVGNEHVATSPSVVKAVDSSYARAVRTTSGLAHYWRLGDSPQNRDSFAGAVGTPLQNRPSEDGSTWTRHDVLSTMSSVITDAGRVRRAAASSASAGSIYYSSIEPSRSDYTVEADIYVASNVANDAIGVIGRYDPGGTATSYVAGYDQVTQTWQLIRFSYGVRYILAQSTPRALTPGQTYRVALDMRGTNLRLFLDGEPLLSVTDAGISIGTAGFGAGYGAGGLSEALTDSTGLHLDNFRVSPPAADVVGAKPGTFLGAALRMLGAIASDVDTAASFDGVDDSATMSTTIGAETSLELWFRSAAGAGAGTTWRDAMPVATVDVPGTDDFGISLAASGQLMAGSGTAAPPVATAGPVADNAWHHVVVTRSESTASLQLYVDGTLQGTTPITVPLSTGATTLRLGRGIDLSRGHFGGQLDEAAWYATVLNSQTVAAHRLAAQ
jgi:hypothetical protein